LSKPEIFNLEKIRKIKLVLTDIDGVWTDGGLYYTKDGMIMKRFNVKDGMGVNRLRERGIETGIVSGDSSEVITIRGQRLKLDLIYIGVRDKKQALDEICGLRNLKYENIAFIGDDVNDIEILQNAGLTAAPADAMDEIIEMVDYVCKRRGGDGAFREFVEFILQTIDPKSSKQTEKVETV
jgi:YrbI family 3-deoxy-D-manno-octulosonate 8-phosphate phosphatase